MSKLDFWFDFASTYSYIAAMRIEQLCADRGVVLTWKPFLLGPIFELQGWNDSPFNINERRGRYMWRDMERLTGKYRIPWQKPTVFPRNSVLAARVACAASDEPWCGNFIRRAFRANFAEDRDISDRAVVDRLLAETGGSGWIARAEAPNMRGMLRENVSRAIELGIFGAPNCVVNLELFWGEETLEDALDWAIAQPAIEA